MAEQRYEREIDELLQRLDKEDRQPLRFRRRRTPPWTAAWRRLSQLSAVQSLVERLMFLSVILLVATLVSGIFFPALARPSGYLAVACFVGALAASVLAGAQGNDPRRYHPERYYQSRGSTVDWNRLIARARRWLGRFRT
jgi:hypothetical protein